MTKAMYSSKLIKQIAVKNHVGLDGGIIFTTP